jgi:hypothetical protein
MQVFRFSFLLLFAVSIYFVSGNSDRHPYGESINILNGLDSDFQSIDKLFMHPEVKDRNVVILSIVGAFRKGKSFLLDYCLRYLYANVSLYFLL